MKGQAVNIDWTIGISLFMLTVLVGTFATFTQDFGAGERQAQRKASIVSQDIKDTTSISGRKTELYVRGPVETGKIPVDRAYIFDSEGHTGTGIMDIPSDIDMEADNIITVTDTGNLSHDIAYFFSNASNKTYPNNITVDNDTGSMENNRISVNVSSPGLTSMKINGNELLNDTADLEASNFTVEEEEIHSYSLNGSLKLYNGSRELVFENGNGTFRLKNLSKLYWYGSGVQDLGSAGTYRDGETRGFTVASDYGVTFKGKDLDAKIEIKDGKVVADINSTRLRIFLHDSNYTAGRKRLNFSAEDDIFFGAEHPTKGVWELELNKLQEKPRRGFKNQLGLSSWEYNITFKDLERGSRIPLQNIVVRNSRTVEIFRNGSYTGIESRVALWR